MSERSAAVRKLDRSHRGRGPPHARVLIVAAAVLRFGCRPRGQRELAPAATACDPNTDCEREFPRRCETTATTSGFRPTLPCHDRQAFRMAILVDGPLSFPFSNGRAIAGSSCTAHHSTTRHNTARHGTARHGTARHSARQRRTGRVDRMARDQQVASNSALKVFSKHGPRRRDRSVSALSGAESTGRDSQTQEGDIWLSLRTRSTT